MERTKAEDKKGGNTRSEVPPVLQRITKKKGESKDSKDVKSMWHAEY